MKRPIIIYAMLFMYVSIIGCSSRDKNQMFEDQLTEYKVTEPYKKVVAATRADLKKWIAEGVEEVQILKECTWKIDDAIFFNTKKDRCYLLLLIQDHNQHAELDYVYLMYGALKGTYWRIYFSSLPNYIDLRERLKLPKNMPVSMEVLSKLSRKELLRIYYKNNGDIDDSFANKAYTIRLKEQHLKFLNK